MLEFESICSKLDLRWLLRYVPDDIRSESSQYGEFPNLKCLKDFQELFVVQARPNLFCEVKQDSKTSNFVEDKKQPVIGLGRLGRLKEFHCFKMLIYKI